jgi:hypothetical protein
MERSSTNTANYKPHSEIFEQETYLAAASSALGKRDQSARD